ncbi:hypothetical protein [Edaphobacter aggregans]|uniref:hypothetical protein n=1 Tax=Edaphobacter aggregans TaxID=570835 RepID=UPI0012F82F8C|nr:hypothetical protein [Edaphobacter aggregans]
MMTSRSIYFFIVVAVFLVAMAAIGGYYFLRARRAKKYPYGRWEDLLRRLASVDSDSIATIALDLVDESGERKSPEDPSDLDPSDIPNLVGGLKGLEVLEQNCAVLIDLAFYVQQWYPEALAVAEDLRSNAREIEWHLGRLRAAEKNGTLESAFAEYGQRAIATYYLMTRRVLALYDQCRLPQLAELQRVI